MSMDAAAIDLSRAFEYGQGYVALSRVRTLDGLHILGWSEQALMVHPLVASRDEAFRELSDEASEVFSALEVSGERVELEKNFVKASGGTWEVDISVPRPAKAKKASTYDETERLLLEGKSIPEVAKERSLTYGTICGHAEKLVAGGKISKDQLTQSLAPELANALPRIHLAFKARGAEHLTPIFDLLKGEITFDDIRLARLLYNG